MGCNTTVIVMNDLLDQIASDPTFGKNLAAAITELSGTSDKQIDVPAYSHKNGIPSGSGSCNAAVAVESHHAEGTSIVAVGRNAATVLTEHPIYPYGDEEYNIRLLKALANQMGYTIRKKPIKK